MKQLFRVFATIFAFGLALNVHAEWPERPIKLIVPFPAANSSDVAARLVGEKLSSRLGQPLIVENRAGVGGTLGIAYGATQPSDGYTLIIGTPGALSVAPWTRANPLPYDPVKDFVAVGFIAWAPQVLVARKDLPVKNFQEFLSYSKRPGVRLQYGTSGVGTVGHLVMAQMLSQTGIKAEHIPYKGGAQVVTDLRGGFIDFMSDTVPVVQGMVADGSIKALGVSTAARVPSMPNVPTLKEQGANVDVQGYILLIAPAKTPSSIVLRLRAAMWSIMQEPDVRKRLIELGLVPMDLPQERLANFIQSESVKWKKLVEISGAAKSEQ